MATRNPANVIEFGKFNYGASITSWTVTAAADVSAETMQQQCKQHYKHYH